ncbi:MAG: methylmalonyl Co-A mutase-associated GTPase MeaB [Hyphomicrobiaceae bacterium]|nr:methylmalonyl Co-A mutase-associated GTPase MeaB [Hyphomicrobiaceae bacterium]
MTTARGRRAPLSLAQLAAGILAGDRAVLARAITLIESTRPGDQEVAQNLLQALLPSSGGAWRIGVTGVPGVGKSTLIDQLGMNLIAAGHEVAVLAVDPTSRRSGGSILGDKTRMARLASSPAAFIRPSPTSGTLGGVTRRTRETMLLAEAAGFDVVIVETVGVGQSETAVADMVDFFLVLMLAGGGDELQGIKKGVIEIADMLVINKADGDNIVRARRSAADYQAALNILTPRSASWTPPVLVASALENRGLDALWEQVSAHRARMTGSGELQARRQEQAVGWMRDMLQERLLADLMARGAARERIDALEEEVRRGRLTAPRAVEAVLGLLRS